MYKFISRESSGILRGTIRIKTLLSYGICGCLLALTGCGFAANTSGTRNDTAYVQHLVDAGLKIPPGVYILRRTIILHSNSIVQGSGPGTIFIFRPTPPFKECWNDRAFTTACDSFYNGTTGQYVKRQRISAPIAIGDQSFQTATQATNLHPGNWIVITERDSVLRDVVAIDWMQVKSVSGHTVQVAKPFRVAFPDTHSWNPVFSGLGFFKVANPVQNVQLRDFTLYVPNAGRNMSAISVYTARHVLVENLNVRDDNGQALYSFQSQDVTFRNCVAYSGPGLSEFASTTDLTVTGNVFSSHGDAGFGLDLGTGFFDVRNNQVTSSMNSGIYALYGVHDGTIEDNKVAAVSASQNRSAVGILLRGTQRVTVTNNTLSGGQGPLSVGLSVDPAQAELPIPSIGNIVSPNVFGNWTMDYSPSNQP